MNRNPDSHPDSHLLHAGPRAVEKILASELNSLSVDDREAINEEMHAVRSLAPSETPEMIQNALLKLEQEINKRLRIALLSFSSSSMQKKGNNKQDKENGEKCVSRREYLRGLLIVSESMSRSAFSTSDTICPTPVTSNPTAYFSNGVSNSNPISMNDNGNIARNKYSYALSKGFLLKFLRAELFEVKKAATRYICCIHFLVDYFGTVALERPLYLKDLDKNEQKMLKEGRLQLMPSRDRLGRRIIVFLGAVGHDYSHRNRFKVVTYMIFQAAADDETTQRNGLVAVSALYDDNIRNVLQLAYHQTECLRLFDAVPLRYSAFHFFLPDELHSIRGLMMNMVGKKIRLITRGHTVSSAIETSYKLRCFGIPTEDFPMTSSGSIKTKNFMKWIKFRVAQEAAHEKGVRAPWYQQQPPLSSQEIASPNSNSFCTSSPFLGIECPELNTVIFRNGGSAWDHPGNIKFRNILTEREPDRDLHKTMAEKHAFLDGIITELFAIDLEFLVYDDKKEWYVKLRDYGVLRKKVFQALRDQSARRKRGETGTRRDQRKNESDRRTHQVNQSSTSLFLNLDNDHNQNYTEKSLKDVKRRKTSVDLNNGWL